MKGDIIPIQDASKFATEHNLDVIVILGWSAVDEEDRVCTWGNTLPQAQYAADAGNRLKLAINWDPKQATAVSAKVQDLIDANKTAQEMITQLHFHLSEKGINPKIFTDSLVKIMNTLKNPVNQFKP